MKNVLLLFYPLLLLAISFWNCEFAGLNSFNEKMWDRDQSKNIRAIACIGVILHHVTQLITDCGAAYSGPITVFSNMGILFTAIFFFFSGYGLMVSVGSKETYLDDFLWHRLPTILIPFFVLNSIYILVLVFWCGYKYTGLEIVKYFFGINLINSNGWYMAEILILYLAFYVLFKYLKNKDVALVLLIAVTLFIIIASMDNGHDLGSNSHWFKGEWWYNTTIVFVMGLLFARFREYIISSFKRFYWVYLTIFTVLTFVGFHYEEIIRKRYGYYLESYVIDSINSSTVTLLSQSIMVLISTTWVLLLNMKLSINNKVLSFLGAISLELFLAHGLFVKYVFDFDRVEKFFVYGIVLVCGIVLGSMAYLIDSFILKKIAALYKTIKIVAGPKTEALRERSNEKSFKIKKYSVLAIVLVIAIFLAQGFAKKYYIIPREFQEEKAAIINANVGEIVYYGHYDIDEKNPGQERMKWIVASKDGCATMLVSLNGIDCGEYNHLHESVSWNECDLRERLNSDEALSHFSELELSIFMYNPNTHDNLSLMSEDEAMRLFSTDEMRELAVTDYALKQGVNINQASKVNYWDMKGYRSSWWWLRSDEAGLMAPVVTVDGVVTHEGKYVNKSDGAIRPVLWVWAE